MKKLLTLTASAMLFFGCAHKAVEPQAPAPAAQPAAPVQAPQLSPEAMMSKMKEAATPGAEHARLQPLVGNWKVTTKAWMDPSKEPEVSKGTAKNQWVLGKRFLRQDFTGKFAGQPFQGLGYFGFDKVKKRYVSTWQDSMGTGLMVSEGDFDAAKNEITMNGKFSCPVANGELTSRTVTRFVGKNEFVFEMYAAGPDGKEFKNLEITYKRAS